MALIAQLVDDVMVHKFELRKAEVLLGRHPENDIVVDDSAVSSYHAAITVEKNKDFPEFLEFFVKDLGSTNGTFINDVPAEGRQRLHHNDIIRIAWNNFKFVDNKEADLEKTTHMLK